MGWGTLRGWCSERARTEKDDTRIADFSIFGGGGFGDCWRGFGVGLVGRAAPAGAVGWKRSDRRVEGWRDCGPRPVGAAVDSREIAARCGDGAGLFDGAGPFVADGFVGAGRRGEICLRFLARWGWLTTGKIALWECGRRRNARRRMLLRKFVRCWKIMRAG